MLEAGVVILSSKLQGSPTAFFKKERMAENTYQENFSRYVYVNA